jgi:hypothetical protein
MSATIKSRRQTILSPRDRERLRNEAKSLERRLAGSLEIPKHRGIKEDGPSTRRQGYLEQFMREDVKEDQKILKERLARVNQALTVGSPPPLSKTDRAKREKEAAEQREWLRKNMAPRSLYYAKPNTPEFEQGKKAAAVEFQPEFQRVAENYVQNLRALDPDNTDRNHIEKLRQ